MDLTELMLLLAMLLCSSALSELKARDPDVEEEENEEFISFSTSHTPCRQEEHLSRSEQLDTQLETPQSPDQPARRGNWCAFVHERLVTSVAELIDDEERIVRSVSPCSNDDPDCRILKLSQPTYRQKQKTTTALQWKCCPGHGGKDCQETVPTDVSQTDDSDSGSGGDIPLPTPPLPPASASPFMDSSSLLALHQIFAAVMVQLQPMLDGFNHTLESLSRKVEGLSVDLKNLKHKQFNMSKSRHEYEAKCEKNLENSFEQMQQIWTELDSQQKDMKQTVNLQQEHLLWNMTSLKDRIDHDIDVSHEEIQASIQSLNKSVEDIRLDRERMQETTQGDHITLPDNGSEGQSMLETSLWEAISSLDMKVLNNTMELSPLTENSKHLINIVQKLDNGLRNLSERLEHVSHNTEVHLAQIGFEVESARVAMLKTVNNLASNHSNQERELRETQLDVDNIYQHLQSNDLVTAGEICSCKEMTDSLTRLESDVANVTNIAKENRYALEDVEAKRGLSQWTPDVEDLNQGLWSVRQSLAFEQVKIKALHDNLAQLKTSVLDSQKEISGLKDQFIAKEAEIRHLSASFTSLLKDAVRHSEVLEVLLGDEVIEFSSWPNIQQKEVAIPALLQKMRLMQDKLDSHERSLNPVRKSRTEKGQMTNDDPVAFEEWILPMDQVIDDDDDDDDHLLDTLGDISKKDDEEDYSVSDFWSLGKEVEQLANRLSMLEQQPCNCTAAPSGSIVELQADVRTLQQTLESHLRTFQNLFRYTEELANSSDGVNLDQVQIMTRTKERKRNKGQNMRKIGETGSRRGKRNNGKN